MGFSLAKLKPENWSRDIAMDLGTASVLVFVEGKESCSMSRPSSP